jgi:hypothetical protein
MHSFRGIKTAKMDLNLEAKKEVKNDEKLAKNDVF